MKKYGDYPQWVQDQIKIQVEKQGHIYLKDTHYNSSKKGFDWEETEQKWNFWNDVLSYHKFELLVDKFGKEIFHETYGLNKVILCGGSNKWYMSFRDTMNNCMFVNADINKETFTKKILGYADVSGDWPYCKTKKDAIKLFYALKNFKQDIEEEPIYKAGVIYECKNGIFQFNEDKYEKNPDTNSINVCWFDGTHWQYNDFLLSFIDVKIASKESRDLYYYGKNHPHTDYTKDDVWDTLDMYPTLSKSIAETDMNDPSSLDINKKDITVSNPEPMIINVDIYSKRKILL